MLHIYIYDISHLRVNKADDSGSTNTIYHDAMCGSNVNRSVVLTSRDGVFQSVASLSTIIV